MKSLVCRIPLVTVAVGLILLLILSMAEKERTRDSLGATGGAGKSNMVTKTLAIPARQQWDDNEGYCGETCVQSVAMYYGTYISQFQARAMINSDQKHELVISANEDLVLKNLRLTYQQWDHNGKATPQCKSYLAWTKQQLRDGYPVIGTVYMREETDPDFDHILPFIGFHSVHDMTNYYDDDELIFYDNYSRGSFIRLFSTMYATRSEATAGHYAYYIPQGEDYGCAVTGIVDPHHETLPVQLSVDRWDEPDVVAGERPVTLHGTLAIHSLVSGRQYSLLRYDDYRKVPSSHFLANGGYVSNRAFTAANRAQTLADTFTSNDCVIYRCVAR
jgi:hypothetical protein